MLNPHLAAAAIQRIADNRIREAEEQGLFDNLPGEGQPLRDLEPGTPESHLMGWARAWLLREDLRPQSRPRPAASPARGSASGEPPSGA